MSQQEHPEKPTPDNEPEAVVPAPDNEPEAAVPAPEPVAAETPRTRGRVNRFVRHHATQLVAVGLLAAVIGGGVGAIATHKEGGDRVHQEHHRGDHEGNHEGDHEDGDR